MAHLVLHRDTERRTSVSHIPLHQFVRRLARQEPAQSPYLTFRQSQSKHPSSLSSPSHFPRLHVLSIGPAGSHPISLVSPLPVPPSSTGYGRCPYPSRLPSSHQAIMRDSRIWPSSMATPLPLPRKRPAPEDTTSAAPSAPPPTTTRRASADVLGFRQGRPST